MKKFNFLGTSAWGSIAVVGALALAAPAYAQTPQPVIPQGDPCQAPADSTEALDCPDADQVQPSTQGATTGSGQEIVVVGSRIRRNQFNTADPIQLITREETTAAGFNSTAEVLQSSAVTGGTAQINDTYGGFVVAGGPGVNTLSLRGLGATRTLVLLNGRRVAPSGSRGAVGSADLNVLPSAAIDRIEILNTGASSIYGSDAIAGVVNLVTRRNMNGITLEAQHNLPEVGAGGSQRYSMTAGASGDRFNILGAVEYFNRTPLEARHRDFTACPTDRYADGSDFIDPRTGQPKCFSIYSGGVTVNTIGTYYIEYDGSNFTLAPGWANPTPPGYTFYCDRWRPNPAVTSPIGNYECVGGLNYLSATQQSGTSLNVRDTFAPSMLREDVIAPAEIYNGFLTGTYDTGILGGAELYGELLLTRRNSHQDGQRQFTLDYPMNSPLLPTELHPHWITEGIGVRMFIDYGIYNNRQTVDFAKASTGLRGDLPWNWRYDLYASKAWSDAEYTTDLILSDRLAQSIDVVQNANGTYSCRVTTGGCVAAPPLSAGLVGGQFRELSPGWFDYVTDPVTGTTKFRENTYALTVDGPLFRLPGGEMAAALGVEYRKASIDDTPGPDSVRGNLHGFTSSTPTRGSDSVWEAFGEVEVPLLRDLPFIYNLTLNGSARYTEYESYGGDWTYKAGALYSPTRWLSFRGSYGTSYRAPALFEQFQGATSGFAPQANDPCHNLVDVTNPLIRERCLADGLPDGFVQNNSITVIGLGGAEAGLEAETSKALTFGGVLQPRLGPAFGDLSIAVDYFDIKIDNGVAQLSSTNILSQCYNNPQRTTCHLVTRAPYIGPGTGGLTVIQSFVNISDARAEGIDYTLRYARDLGPGRFRLGAQLTQMFERYSRQLPTSDILNLIGEIGHPKWTGTFDASYTWNPWTIRYGLDWIKGTSDNEYLEQFGWEPEVYNYTLPDYFLHTASLRYDTERMGITFGVRNLLDKDPPLISVENPLRTVVGNVPLASGFDMRGRTFFINTRFSF